MHELPPLPVIRALQAYSARGGRRSIRRFVRPLTEDRLREWLAYAQIGQAIQYHKGCLSQDRSEIDSTLVLRERRRIDTLADLAWKAHELCLVHLFSLRTEDRGFRYFAIRSGLPLPASAELELTASYPVFTPLEGETP